MEAPRRSWIDRFLARPGNELFVRVNRAYIADGFNHKGLARFVPDLAESLLALLAPAGHPFSSPRAARSTELLYGLLHARFVRTQEGLALLGEKYMDGKLGHCPRYKCLLHPMLPTGLSDLPQQSRVHFYCVRCMQLYLPQSRLHERIDGAYFGAGLHEMLFFEQPLFRPMMRGEKRLPTLFDVQLVRAAREAKEAGREAPAPFPNRQVRRPGWKPPPLRRRRRRVWERSRDRMWRRQRPRKKDRRVAGERKPRRKVAGQPAPAEEHDPEHDQPDTIKPAATQVEGDLSEGDDKLSSLPDRELRTDESCGLDDSYDTASSGQSKDSVSSGGGIAQSAKQSAEGEEAEDEEMREMSDSAEQTVTAPTSVDPLINGVGSISTSAGSRETFAPSTAPSELPSLASTGSSDPPMAASH